MGVRVRGLPEYFEAVTADLKARRASIVDCDLTLTSAVVRATAPLARLLGYSQDLAQLTAGTAHEVTWLSHYAPVDTAPPANNAV
jgi:translation elongation factor EF-G